MGEADQDTIARYLNVLRRKIDPKPRTTKKSRTFSCPSEYEAGFNALVATSEAGGDLRPYQSMGVENDTFDDGLLNDFGVQHFHLGEVLYARNPAFMDRTGPLLYARVTDTALYCLFVLPHGEWANQMLLDIMHEDFTELTDNTTVKNTADAGSGARYTYSDKEVQKMRDAGINVVSQRWDGKRTFPPGGGVTLSRKPGQKSVAVMRGSIDVIRFLKKLEQETAQQINADPEAKKHTTIELKLTEKSGKLVAEDANIGLSVVLDTEIAKPL